MKKPEQKTVAAIVQKLNQVAGMKIGEAKKTMASGILKEAKENPSVKNWVRKYSGKTFTWLKGREKGMSFEISHFGQDVSGRDPHVRGSYENHPQFGDIRDDAHQLNALLDDIVRGDVKVVDYDGGEEEDITAKCKQDSERLIDDLNDEDEYGDDEDDDDLDEDTDDEHDTCGAEAIGKVADAVGKVATVAGEVAPLLMGDDEECQERCCG